MFAPESLKGQLEYIQKHWGTWLGEWVKRIFVGMDTISEEEKAALKAEFGKRRAERGNRGPRPEAGRRDGKRRSRGERPEAPVNAPTTLEL